MQDTGRVEGEMCSRGHPQPAQRALHINSLAFKNVSDIVVTSSDDTAKCCVSIELVPRKADLAGAPTRWRPDQPG